jgi:signal transduction histidine kinase
VSTSSWTLRVVPPDPQRPLLLGRGASFALGLTWTAVAVAVLVARDPAEGPTRPLLTAACLALALAIGLRFSRDDRPSIFAYFVVTTALVGAAVMLSRGSAAIALMPLLSQACLVLPRSGVFVLASLHFLLFVVALPANEPRVIQGQSMGLVIASVFTWLFTELAIRERTARTEVERLASSLDMANSEIARLAVADERLRLSREIHDGVGHALTAAHIQIEAARVLLEADGEAARAHLSNASALLREGLDDVRSSVRELRDERMNTERFVERLGTLCVGESPKVTLVVGGTPSTLDAARAHTLFRVAQEGLTNARRHAGASHVDVRLAFGTHALTLTIEDDGQAPATLSPGLGLTGLVERVERHGGTVRLSRSDSGGARVHATMPLG